jgi:hypothetical protein
VFVIAPCHPASRQRRVPGLCDRRLLALMFAFCYAELGRAHNSAGGEYVYAKRVFGGMAGYATFLTVLVMLLFIPPVWPRGGNVPQ